LRSNGERLTAFFTTDSTDSTDGYGLRQRLFTTESTEDTECSGNDDNGERLFAAKNTKEHESYGYGRRQRLFPIEVVVAVADEFPCFPCFPWLKKAVAVRRKP